MASDTSRPVEGLTSGEGDTVPLYSFDEAWGELVNKDDRTSPEEYPDMCLITREELRCYMEARQCAPAATPTQPLTASGSFACRFDGVDYSRANLQIAQRAACAIVPLYGTGDHGEQEAAQAGKLWNDHPAVQGALRALHEARVGTAPNGALEAIDRFVTDHVGNDDTPEGIEVDQRAQEAVAVLRAMLAASPKVTATASVREAFAGLEWTDDRYSLRTPYDGDADGDGRHVVVGGEVVVTFADSDQGDRVRLLVAEAVDDEPLTDRGTAAAIGGERA